MSVVVVVRKGGKAAICADTLMTQGDIRVPGSLRRSPGKIHPLHDGFVGLTGSSAHHRVFTSLVKHHADSFDFSSAEGVFETLRNLHPKLKDDYFVMTGEQDDEQEYESNQLFGLACNPAGIFGFQSYREVSEYEQFWASGSGTEVALGALHVAYPRLDSARAIAEAAVEAACTFEKHCGTPLETYEVALA